MGNVVNISEDLFQIYKYHPQNCIEDDVELLLDSSNFDGYGSIANLQAAFKSACCLINKFAHGEKIIVLTCDNSSLVPMYNNLFGVKKEEQQQVVIVRTIDYLPRSDETNDNLELSLDGFETQISNNAVYHNITAIELTMLYNAFQKKLYSLDVLNQVTNTKTSLKGSYLSSLKEHEILHVPAIESKEALKKYLEERNLTFYDYSIDVCYTEYLKHKDLNQIIDSISNAHDIVTNLVVLSRAQNLEKKFKSLYKEIEEDTKCIIMHQDAFNYIIHNSIEQNPWNFSFLKPPIFILGSAIGNHTNLYPMEILSDLEFQLWQPNYDGIPNKCQKYILKDFQPKILSLSYLKHSSLLSLRSQFSIHTPTRNLNIYKVFIRYTPYYNNSHQCPYMIVCDKELITRDYTQFSLKKIESAPELDLRECYESFLNFLHVSFADKEQWNWLQETFCSEEAVPYLIFPFNETENGIEILHIKVDDTTIPSKGELKAGDIVQLCYDDKYIFRVIEVHEACSLPSYHADRHQSAECFDFADLTRNICTVESIVPIAPGDIECKYYTEDMLIRINLHEIIAKHMHLFYKILESINCANSLANASYKVPTNEKGIPITFICPLTNMPYTNPVITCSGNSYDLDALEEWKTHSNVDPLSWESLNIEPLCENVPLRDATLKYLRAMELFEAVKSNNESILDEKYLCESDPEGRTCLHYAVEIQNIDMIRYLISKDRNLCFMYNRWGYSPLHLAIEYDADTFAITFVELEPPLRDQRVKDSYITPVWLALKKLNHSLLVELLKRKCDTSIKGEGECTVLHFAIANGNSLKSIQAILQADSSLLNSVDSNGNTPLHLCLQQLSNQEVKGKTIENIEFLLDCGADIKIRNNLGETFSELLNRNKLLSNRFSNLLKNDQPKHAHSQHFIYDSLKRNSEQTDASLKHGNEKFVNNNLEEFRLHLSIRNDDTELFKLLLPSCQDINNFDYSGKTPLHLIIEQNNLQMLNIFINYLKSNPCTLKNSEDYVL